VLDASAVLAVIQAEPGRERLTPELLANAICSAVNLAEVQAKLVSRGLTSQQAWEDATSPLVQIVPFNSEQARISGDLVTQTKPLGLSLGDRACLALGIELDAPVYTAEKAWNKLKVGVPIHVIR
jgi:PIN domain nuclease of toxin-antitoxin system